MTKEERKEAREKFEASKSTSFPYYSGLDCIKALDALDRRDAMILKMLLELDEIGDCKGLTIIEARKMIEE